MQTWTQARIERLQRWHAMVAEAAMPSDRLAKTILARLEAALRYLHGRPYGLSGRPF